MDLAAILKQLRDQLDAVNQSILTIERMGAGQATRRGRPPKWLVEAKTPVAAKRRGRPPGRPPKPAGKRPAAE